MTRAEQFLCVYSQRLKAYFRVFSEQGITITPAIIKDFFDSAKET